MEVIVLKSVSKVCERDFYLPAITMRRHDRDVVLVGLLHYAERRYYEYLQSLLQRLDSAGYAVLYEFEDQEYLKQRWQFRFGEARAQVLLDLQQSTRDKLRDEYGIWFQTECIRVQSHWILADTLKPVQDSVAQWAETLPGKWEDVYRLTLKDAQELLQNTAMFTMGLRMLLQLDEEEALGVIEDMATERGISKDSILDTRNAFALEQILAQVESRSVVSYWGCAHLAGLKAGLELAGFSEVDREWHKVLTFPEVDLDVKF